MIKSAVDDLESSDRISEGTPYSTSSQPVQMAFNLFETATTNKQKPPIIIMHGLFGSKQNWRGIGRALEAKLKRRIYALDARNHGDSPHTAEHNTFLMAADVKEFMAKHEIPKAVCMGHSMGGRTMMHVALEYPDLVDRTIIVDISPIDLPRDFSSMEQIFVAMQKITVSPSVNMAEGRAIVEKQIKKVVDSQGTVDFIMMNLRKKEDGEFYWAPNVEALHNNFREFGKFRRSVERFPPHNGPTIFICGNESNFVNSKDWPEIQKIFPNSQIYWLNAGHLVHFDQPAQFIELIVEFCNS